MTTPHPLPEDLTPHEVLLYTYLTSNDPTLPNPLTFLEEEPAYWTAANGPRTPDEALHILTTPHLLTLLTELWNDTPPTPETLTHCATTNAGRTLLTATGHTPPPTPDNIDEQLTPEVLAAFHFDLEHALLAALDEPGLVYRTPSTTPTPTNRVTATNNPDLELEITQTTHPDTGQPQLTIRAPRPKILTTTGHTTWTLTATYTHPDHTTTTHTDTQTITDPLISPYWTTPPPRPNTTLTLTLTPTHP